MREHPTAPDPNRGMSSMRAVRTVSILRQFTQDLSLDSFSLASWHVPNAREFPKGNPMETKDFTIGWRKRFFLVWANSPRAKVWLRGKTSDPAHVDDFLDQPIPIERRNVLAVVRQINEAKLSLRFETDAEWAEAARAGGAA